jgi:hypothetical protein
VTPYRVVNSRGVEGSLRLLSSGASSLILYCLRSKIKALWFFETSLLTSRYGVTFQKTAVPLWESHLARDIFITNVENGRHFNTFEDTLVYVSLKWSIVFNRTFFYCSRTGIQQFINLLRRIFFSSNFSTPVFKMWVIQKPNKVALWNKRHFEEKKWRLYSMFKIFGTDICWINIKWGV